VGDRGQRGGTGYRCFFGGVVVLRSCRRLGDESSGAVSVMIRKGRMDERVLWVIYVDSDISERTISERAASERTTSEHQQFRP